MIPAHLLGHLSRSSGTVCVDGATLRYVIEGYGVPALVIGSSIYYPRTFSQQLREALCLAFMDVRHFAETSTSHSPGIITLDTYTDDIERVRSEIGFERAAVIGHSHHGNLALEYAKRYPEKVSHVVLIGSPPCNVERTIQAGIDYWSAYATEERKAVLQDNWRALRAESIETLPPEAALVAEYVANGPKYWFDTSFNASSLWQGVPVNMDLIQMFRGFFTDYELSWNPAQMRAPVLVVMGRHDYVVPHLLWEVARPKLGNLTYHLLEQSGHTPQLEEPKLFDRVLLEWIQKYPDESGSASL